MNLVLAGLTGLVAVCGSTIPGCAPTPAPAAPAGGTHEKPICDTSYGWVVDGQLIVTVEHTAEVPCDLTPVRLDLVWNEHSEGADWGSDASVARATQEALDFGCDLQWFNDGDFRLVGTECDF